MWGIKDEQESETLGEQSLSKSRGCKESVRETGEIGEIDDLGHTTN